MSRPSEHDGISQSSLWELAKLENAHMVPLWQLKGPDLWPEEGSDELARFSSALQRAPDEQTRLLCAERILPAFPFWPGLRALLAHYYAKFEDGVSAQEQITAFYTVCSREVDPIFDASTDNSGISFPYSYPPPVSAEELYGSECHVAFPWTPVTYRDAFTRNPLPAKAPLTGVFARWRTLSASNQPSEIIARYLRYQIIETHEIEGVLALDDETIKSLTRVGFHENAIDTILPTSALTSKDAMVKSLNDCDSALQRIKSIAGGALSLDAKLVLALHELVQRQSRFETLIYDGIPSIVVKRAGALRGEVCFTTLHSDDTAIVEFAPADALPDLFLSMVEDFAAS
ncbi:hypothetical protein DFH09DRAFT_1334679 [Mycena vulgaris]|nr:hypothetical protein DFH09DRAFT_1334679 [Mycena vulgaris]